MERYKMKNLPTNYKLIEKDGEIHLFQHGSHHYSVVVPDTEYDKKTKQWIDTFPDTDWGILGWTYMGQTQEQAKKYALKRYNKLKMWKKEHPNLKEWLETDRKEWRLNKCLTCDDQTYAKFYEYYA